MFGNPLSLLRQMAPYRFVGEQRACALCQQTQYDVVGTRDRYLQRLRTVICRSCGLVFTNPMPRAEELKVYYERHYRLIYAKSKFPRRAHIHRNIRRAKERFRFLNRQLTGPARILDVGSGAGEFLHVAGDAGHDVIGIEPNPDYAAFAENQYDVSVQRCGWRDADIGTQSVDMITAHHVLEHFPDPLAALRCFRTWLKPDGLLYVSVPNIENPKQTPFTRFHFAHLYNFNPASLIMMARSAGFEPIPNINTDSTTLIFHQRDMLDDEITDQGLDNYRRLSDFLDRHNNRRHFLSMTPYLRLVNRITKQVISSVLSNIRTLPGTK